MRISVALCSYNGEQFIAEQLRSILNQTRRPDEIVVFDDGSTDDSVAIARSVLLADAVPTSIDVVIQTNPINLGVRENFARAARAATGDLVFLCDQDDVWLPNKIARIAEEFENDPSLDLVHTDARLIGDGGDSLGLGLFDALEMQPAELSLIREGRAFRVLIRRNVITGATCAFRSRLLKTALPFPEGWIHDEWLGIVAAAIGNVKCLVEPLTEYRQHASNQIGIRKRGVGEKLRHMFSKRGDFYMRQVDRAEALIMKLQGLPAAADKLSDLYDWRAHLSFRAALPPNRLKRIKPIRNEIASGRYARYSFGFRSVVRDILESP